MAAFETMPRADQNLAEAAMPTVASGQASAPAERVFSTSVVVSGVRCVLAYVVFPWILPLVGIASRVGAGLGLAIGAVAIVFNVVSIRRFQSSRHRYRWVITVLNSGIIVLLSILMVIDINSLIA